MMTFRMEINVLIGDEFREHLAPDWLKDIARKALAAQESGADTEMGLVITDQEKLRELNNRYRGKDEATDVLAFPMLGGEAAAFTAPPDSQKHLGEVIISYPQAVIQAGEQGHPVKRELAILIVHGVLHLLGYDHMKAEDEHQMKEREAEILKDIEGELS